VLLYSHVSSGLLCASLCYFFSNEPYSKIRWGGLAAPSAVPSSYTNANFHAARLSNSSSNAWIGSLEKTWTDQRAWAIDLALDAIGDQELSTAIEVERQSVMERENAPSTAGLTKTTVGKPVAVGGFLLTVDTAGAIVGLEDVRGNEWAGAGAALVWARYSLGTNAQMAKYRSVYCSGTIRSGDEHCGEATYGKPGQPRTEPLVANATVRSVWTGRNMLLVELVWDQQLHQEYGAPAATWLKLSTPADDTSDALDLDVVLVNKTATRMMESMFLTFKPDGVNSATAPCEWAMDKLGEWVTPLEVMKGGSGGISPIGSGIKCARRRVRQSRARSSSSSSSPTMDHMFVRSLDSGVVHWGNANQQANDMLPLATPIYSPPDVRTGAHFVLYDNLWNTNYVYWWPFQGKSMHENRLFRFRLEFAATP
jgi:hypothetical protein